MVARAMERWCAGSTVVREQEEGKITPSGHVELEISGVISGTNPRRELGSGDRVLLYRSFSVS